MTRFRSLSLRQPEDGRRCSWLKGMRAMPAMIPDMAGSTPCPHSSMIWCTVWMSLVKGMTSRLSGMPLKLKTRDPLTSGFLAA